MNLADINADFYNYIRGAILILSLYHFFIFLNNRDNTFLYYSLYFLFIFLFFLGQSLTSGKLKNLYILVTPSIHLISYAFYISFARELLKTKIVLPKWDTYLILARKLLIISIPILILLIIFFGHKSQVSLFFIIAPFFSIFSLISYYVFFSMKGEIVKYFVFGSLLFFVFANISFCFNIFYNFQEFIDAFNLHPTFFTYVGAILEAIVFALLLGYKISRLETESKDIAQKIVTLKSLVVKNHIILKDKTKVYIIDLMYIKSDDHYLNIFLNEGKNHFVRGKLSQIKEELPPNFIQCHRSYIVNSNFVKQINGGSLTLLDKTQIPLSRSYKEKF